MNRPYSGIIAGLVFGLLDVLLMIPLPLENKMIAMVASFINRFAIGFFIVNTDIPTPPWMKGILIGLVLSLPDALITKAYIPILGIGIVGGLCVSLIIK